MGKRIITAAITGGIHTPCMSDYLPITPQQIADEAVRSYEAGAAVAHIHVRNPETGRPLADMDLYREIVTKVKAQCNICLCLTTGGALGMSLEDRVKTVTTFEPELASLNSGSINFGLFPALEKYKNFKFDWEEQYLAMTEDVIFPNTFKSMKEFAGIFKKRGTRPELEVYDSAMINNVAYMISKGYIEKPVYLQFVMGVLGGITPGPENLMFLVDYARRQIGDFEFSVCVAGRDQFSMCTQSLLLGGHLRVGLEDNLYIERGKFAKSNAVQVAKMKRIATELGLEIATPDEARQILKLKGMENMKI
jgi:uncharacterized protein (DUF849 family)